MDLVFLALVFLVNLSKSEICDILFENDQQIAPVAGMKLGNIMSLPKNFEVSFEFQLNSIGAGWTNLFQIGSADGGVRRFTLTLNSELKLELTCGNDCEINVVHDIGLKLNALHKIYVVSFEEKFYVYVDNQRKIKDYDLNGPKSSYDNVDIFAASNNDYTVPIDGFIQNIKIAESQSKTPCYLLKTIESSVLGKKWVYTPIQNETIDLYETPKVIIGSVDVTTEYQIDIEFELGTGRNMQTGAWPAIFWIGVVHSLHFAPSSKQSQAYDTLTIHEDEDISSNRKSADFSYDFKNEKIYNLTLINLKSSNCNAKLFINGVRVAMFDDLNVFTTNRLNQKVIFGGNSANEADMKILNFSYQQLNPSSCSDYGTRAIVHKSEFGISECSSTDWFDNNDNKTCRDKDSCAVSEGRQDINSICGKSTSCLNTIGSWNCDCSVLNNDKFDQWGDKKQECLLWVTDKGNVVKDNNKVAYDWGKVSVFKNFQLSFNLKLRDNDKRGEIYSWSDGNAYPLVRTNENHSLVIRMSKTTGGEQQVLGLLDNITLSKDWIPVMIHSMENTGKGVEKG